MTGLHRAPSSPGLTETSTSSPLRMSPRRSGDGPPSTTSAPGGGRRCDVGPCSPREVDEHGDAGAGGAGVLTAGMRPSKSQASLGAGLRFPQRERSRHLSKTPGAAPSRNGPRGRGFPALPSDHRTDRAPIAQEEHPSPKTIKRLGCFNDPWGCIQPLSELGLLDDEPLRGAQGKPAPSETSARRSCASPGAPEPA